MGVIGGGRNEQNFLLDEAGGEPMEKALFIDVLRVFRREVYEPLEPRGATLQGGIYDNVCEWSLRGNGDGK
jgi:hypothetical protein